MNCLEIFHKRAPWHINVNEELKNRVALMEIYIAVVTAYLGGQCKKGKL